MSIDFLSPSSINTFPEERKKLEKNSNIIPKLALENLSKSDPQISGSQTIASPLFRRTSEKLPPSFIKTTIKKSKSSNQFPVLISKNSREVDMSAIILNSPKNSGFTNISQAKSASGVKETIKLPHLKATSITSSSESNSTETFSSPFGSANNDQRKRSSTKKTIEKTNSKCIRKKVSFTHSQQELLTDVNQNANDSLNSQKKAEQRVYINKELNNICKCIFRILDQSNYMPFATYNSWLSCRRESQNSKKDLEDLENAFHFIYEVMNKALDHNITVFSYERDHLISLKKLQSMISTQIKKKLKNKRDLSKKIDLFETRLLNYEIRLLNYDTTSCECEFTFEEKPPFFNLTSSSTEKIDSDSLAENAAKYASLLQTMSTNTLITAYKHDFYKIEDLAAIIQYLLGLPKENMPDMLKIQLLNFYKLLLLENENKRINFSLELKEQLAKLDIKSPQEKELNIISALKNEVKTIAKKPSDIRYLQEIKFKKDTNQTIQNFYEDIELLQGKISKEITYYKNSPRINIRDLLTDIISNKINPNDLNGYIDVISNDLKIHAACTISSMTFDACLRLEKGQQGLIEPSIYEKKLMTFVQITFCSILKKYVQNLKKYTHNMDENQSQINLEFFYLFNFFLKIADASIKKQDYCSSFIIYGALCSQHLHKVFKNKKFPKMNQKLIDIDSSLQQIFQQDPLLKTLNKKIVECQENSIFYVPYLPCLTNKILRRMEEIKTEIDQETRDLKIIKYKADQANSKSDVDLEEILEEIILDPKQVEFLALKKIKKISQLDMYINAIFDDMRFKLEAFANQYSIQSNISSSINYYIENPFLDSSFDNSFTIIVESENTFQEHFEKLMKMYIQILESEEK